MGRETCPLIDIWQPSMSASGADYAHLVKIAKETIEEHAGQLGHRYGNLFVEVLAERVNQHLHLLGHVNGLGDITPQTAMMMLSGVQQYVWDNKARITLALHDDHREAHAMIDWLTKGPALRNLVRMTYAIRVLCRLRSNESAERLLHGWLERALTGYRLSVLRTRQRDVSPTL